MAIFDKLLQWFVIPLKQKDNKNVCFFNCSQEPHAYLKQKKLKTFNFAQKLKLKRCAFLSVSADTDGKAAGH